MKKRLSFIVCLCLSLALCMSIFVGCGGDKPEEEEKPTVKCDLTISETSITLNVNTSKQLTASTNDNSKYTFTWSSSNDSVASVSDGLVTAKAAGEATITVGCRVKGSATVIEKKTCKVTVESHQVVLDKKAALIDLAKGATVDIDAQVEGGNDPIVWSSTDESVASVADGVVTGHKTGSVTITAESGDVSADCRITVVNKQSVGLGKSITLTTSLASATWASDNIPVATVSGGEVTGVAYGTATITATAGDKSESFIVTVAPDAQLESSYELESGNKAAAAEKPTFWNYLLESSLVTVSGTPTYDKGVLSMDVTYVGESGTNFAYLRYQPDTVGGKFYKAHIYIWAAEDGVIAINGVDTDIPKGASVRTLEYTSKKPSAKDPFQLKFRTATTYIIAPYFEESVPEAQLVLDKTSIELLTEEGSNTATITATYEEGATFEWESSDPAVATVENGVVTALSEGTATITCKSGGKSATCTVVVKATSVTLSETFVTLYDVENTEDASGKTHTLTATASDSSAITWASSDPETVTVDGGTIAGVKEGWAVVTATSASGASRDCVVFVTKSAARYDMKEGKNATMKDNPGIWCWSAQAVNAVYDNGVITKTFTDTHLAVSGSNTFMLRFMPPEFGTWKVTFKLRITDTGAGVDETIKAELNGTGGTGEYTVADLAEGVEITNEFKADNSGKSGTFFQLKISGIAENVPAVIEVSEIVFAKVA